MRLIGIIVAGSALIAGAVTIASGVGSGPVASSVGVVSGGSDIVRGAQVGGFGGGNGVPPDSPSAGASSPASGQVPTTVAAGRALAADSVPGSAYSRHSASRKALKRTSKATSALTAQSTSSTAGTTSSLSGSASPLAAASTTKVKAATTKTRSGLPWMSGAYVPQDTPAALNAFGTWRKAPTDVVLLYGGFDTWDHIDNPSWVFSTWKKATQTVVLSAAPFPLTGASLADCADGDYDAYWQTFGTNVQAAGMAKRMIIRLGWEFNGSWNPWAAFNPALYVGCYRHVHDAAEAAAPGLRWEWSVNRGVGDALPDAQAAWPGIHYVDIVGISSYDGWPPANNAAGWAVQYAGPQGLKFWADFARSKHKQLSLAEWGLYSGTSWAGHEGGDDPYYITKMFGFFRQEKSIMAYESYFDEDDPYQAGALQLNPKGAAEYLKQIAAARKLK